MGTREGAPTKAISTKDKKDDWTNWGQEKVSQVFTRAYKYSKVLFKSLLILYFRIWISLFHFFSRDGKLFPTSKFLNKKFFERKLSL